jgi:hypothetical protein
MIPEKLKKYTTPQMNRTLQLFIGIFYVFFVLWARMFRDYFPRPWSSFLSLSYLWIIFFLLLWLTFFLLSIHGLGDFSRKSLPEPYHSFFSSLVDSPSKIFPALWEPLSYLSGRYLPHLDIFLKKIVYILLHLWRRNDQFWLTFSSFLLSLPPFLLSVIFSLEMIFFSEVSLFYRLIPFLLIPLLFRCLLHGLTHWVSLEKEYIEEKVFFITFSSPRDMILQPRYPISERYFLRCENHYTFYLEFLSYAEGFRQEYSQFSLILLFFTSFNYLLSWSSILLAKVNLDLGPFSFFL